MDARDKWKPGASRPLALVPTTRSSLVGGCIGAIHTPAPNRARLSIKRDSRRIKSHNPWVKGGKGSPARRDGTIDLVIFPTLSLGKIHSTWHCSHFSHFLSFPLRITPRQRSIPSDHSARGFVQIRNALIPEEMRGIAQESKVRLSERGFIRLFSSELHSHPPR